MQVQADQSHFKAPVSALRCRSHFTTYARSNESLLCTNKLSVDKNKNKSYTFVTPDVCARSQKPQCPDWHVCVNEELGPPRAAQRLMECCPE
jgi:hypothetical protein